MRTPLLAAGILLLARLSFAQTCVPEPAAGKEEPEGEYTAEEMRLLKPPFKEVYTLAKQEGGMEKISSNGVFLDAYKNSHRKLSKVFEDFKRLDADPKISLQPGQDRVYNQFSQYFLEDVVECLKDPTRVDNETFEDLYAVCLEDGMKTNSICSQWRKFNKKWIDRRKKRREPQ